MHFSAFIYLFIYLFIVIVEFFAHLGQITYLNFILNISLNLIHLLGQLK